MNMQDLWARVLLRKELRKQILETEKKLDDLRTAYERLQKDRLIKYFEKNKERL